MDLVYADDFEIRQSVPFTNGEKILFDDNGEGSVKDLGQDTYYTVDDNGKLHQTTDRDKATIRIYGSALVNGAYAGIGVGVSEWWTEKDARELFESSLPPEEKQKVRGSKVYVRREEDGSEVLFAKIWVKQVPGEPYMGVPTVGFKDVAIIHYENGKAVRIQRLDNAHTQARVQNPKDSNTQGQDSVRE